MDLDATWVGPMSLGIGIGVLALVALMLLLYRVGRRHHAVVEDAALWSGGAYQCPRCGQPMTQGWVLLGKGAIWSDRARGRPGLLAHIGDALPNTLSLHLPPAANMAWRCDGCRLLLIDHGKLVR